MKKNRICILFALVLAVSACATTETPQSIAAKTLLSTRQGIIGAAATVDGLCTQGILKPAACNKAAMLYKQAQPAYITASDAFLLYLTATGDTGAKQKFTASVDNLKAVLTGINLVIKEPSK